MDSHKLLRKTEDSKHKLHFEELLSIFQSKCSKYFRFKKRKNL